MIANMLRKKDDKPLLYTDFMPADMRVVDPEDQFWEDVRALAGVKHGEH